MKYTAAILAALAARVSAKSEPAAVATPQVTPPGEGSSECHQSVKGPLKLTVVEEKKEKRGIDQLEVSSFRQFPPRHIQALPSPSLLDFPSPRGHSRSPFPSETY